MKNMKLNIQLFGHTNSTQNYNLPQFIGSDKPTWLGDVNTAMSTIDTAIGTNASNISSLGTRVTSTEGIASQASTDVTSLRGTVNTLSDNVTTVTTTANNAQSTATSALNTANSANDKADTNATKIGDLTSLTTTDKTDVVSAINENVTSINGILDDLVYTENVTLASNITINANSNYGNSSQSKTITPRSGYKPVLVTHENNYAKGINLWYCNLVSDTQIRWNAGNLTGSQITGATIIVRVLYIKTSAVYTES